MIIAVSLNPAVDRTVVLDSLVPGDTNRVKESRTDPGGKGINVARVLREFKVPCLVLGFVAGALGRFLEHTLDELGIAYDFIHIRGQTRTNTTIVDLQHSSQTIISEPGPETSLRHLVQIQHKLKEYVHPGDWVVMSGSLPPPLETDTYARLIRLAKELGAHTVLDADGPPLTQGLRAQPYMVKQNLPELQRLVGRDLPGIEALGQAAVEVQAKGVTITVASISELGAVALSPEGRWRAQPPRLKVVSAVGAGDALVAGMVLELSRGSSLSQALRTGTAAASATVLTPGTELCHSTDVERLLPQIQVTPF